MNGVLHRDIKPSNILIDWLGAAYLTDFGFAIKVEEAKGDTRVAGTPAYMSPEQWSGRVDARSDLWSLGVVLFELLSGARLFQGSALNELRAAICCQPIPRLRSLAGNVPCELERVARPRNGRGTSWEAVLALPTMAACL